MDGAPLCRRCGGLATNPNIPYCRFCGNPVHQGAPGVPYRSWPQEPVLGRGGSTSFFVLRVALIALAVALSGIATCITVFATD